eukprot:XP_011675132.1 PREDICTED: cuticle-degrading serine protease [Strongylocentrotus purpuratus]
MRAIISLLLVAAAAADLAPLLENSEPVPGKYIIKLKNGINVDEMTTTVSLFGGKIGYKFRRALNGFAAELADNVLDIVRNLPAVEYVEQEGIYRPQGVTWGLDRIDQTNLPLDGRYNPFATGKGYTVRLLDSGIRSSHNEFEGRAYHVANFADKHDYDCYGHGTHCAGTVGAKNYGVASEVTIYSVKVFDCNGYATTSWIIKAVDYTIEYANRYSVASMSIGGGKSRSMDESVEELVKSGVPAAVAAGNENENACDHSPAAAPSAITVGASDWKDLRAEFSNWGPCLDIYAPGLYIDSLGYRTDYEITQKSGTSMACPHVAGAIALYAKNTDNLLAYSNKDKLGWLSSACPNKLLYV